MPMVGIVGCDVTKRHTNLFIQVPASSSKGATRTDPLIHAREAFNLACVEQLVPLLSPDTIEHVAFPLCLPYAHISLSSAPRSDQFVSHQGI